MKQAVQRHAALRGGALDGMRFAAALLIVVYHYGSEAPVALESLSDVFARGYLATDFFLMLSGFVLGRAYGAQVLEGRVGGFAFWRKRAERVWPGHLVALGALVVLYVGATAAGFATSHPENYTWRALALQVFLVQAWGVPGGDGWNQPSWSLSALIVCYALFPFSWRALSRVKQAWVVALIGLAVVFVTDLVTQAAIGRRAFDLPTGLALVRAVPLFCLGACLARVVNEGQPRPQVAAWLCAGAALAFAGLQALGRWDFSSIVCIAVIVLALGRLPIAKPSALLERAAKLSFALFITHPATGLAYWGAAKVLAKRVELGTAGGWALWACSVPVAVMVAWAFDRFVDEPIQRWLAARRGGRPTGAPVPAPATT